MGLGETVFPLGYIRDGYKDVLAMFDAGMMLVPGSDASCRAAMQMAAMAKPVLVAERGVLPDIVLDGKTGLVVKDSAENLASAMLSLVAMPPEERLQMGHLGRKRICDLFSVERQVEDIIQVYQDVLGE
jgi:glycosyltransferase involved in cell wall biosynthesis